MFKIFCKDFTNIIWYIGFEKIQGGQNKMSRKQQREYVAIPDFSIGSILEELEAWVKGKQFFSIDMVAGGEYGYVKTQKQNNLHCLRLVFGLLVYGKNVEEISKFRTMNPFDGWLVESTDTKLRNHSLKITNAFTDLICDLDKDDLKHTIIDVLERYFAESNKYHLLLEFCKKISKRGILPPYNTVSTYHNFLSKYSGDIDLSTPDEIINNAAEVLSETLMFSFNIDNITRDEKSSYRLTKFIWNKSSDYHNYDPHRELSFIECQNELTQSTAVRFCLISKEKREKEEKKIYYSLERALDFIKGHACVILGINIDENTNDTLNIYVREFYNHQNTLEFCDDEVWQIPACIKLVEEYKQDFIKKLSWKKFDYDIAKMCEVGLLTQKKWRALAYFDVYEESKEIICFCDTKRRIDGNVELGIAVCRQDYRNQDLVSSLIFYHILSNYGSRIYGGTAEANGPMNRVFERCGFKEHMNYDHVHKLQSKRVRERFTSEIPPEDKNKLTNSIYYQRWSLQEEIVNAFIIKKNEKQKDVGVRS